MRFSSRLALSSLVAVALASCGSSHTGAPDASGATDSGPPGADASAADSGAPADDAAADACAFVDTVDRTCADVTDCVVRLHQTDCCGSVIAIGVNTSATATYDPAEAACMASYPGCGCAAMPGTTDSGETFFATSDVNVACVTVGPTAVCRTYVSMPPPPGR